MGKKRKSRQARLTFTPLPSSSPARASQPEAIRDRAAAVTVTDSPPSLRPAKKRKKDLGDFFLPTPRTSSQNETLPQDVVTSKSTSSQSRTRSSFMKRKNLRGEGETGESVKTKPSPAAAKVLEMFDDSESDAPALQSSPTARKHGSARKAREVVNLASESDPESDDVIRTKRTRKKQTAVASPRNSDEPKGRTDEDESMEDEPVHRSKGRRKKKTESPDPTTKNEQDQADLDEDLEFLGDAEVDSPRALRQRGTSSKLNARQKALDALKKRRLSRTDTENHQDENNKDSRQENSDDDNEDDASQSAASLADSDDDSLPQQMGLDDEDDFVVEDDEDDPLGAPVELPLEFSNMQTRKPKELFKYVVEWMVQKKINPAFAMNDQIYQFSFQRLDDFVRGLGGSKFQSSAWTSAFSRSLRFRPTLVEIPYGGGTLGDHCHACNRSNHPATWEVRFTGNTYDKESLEELSDDESADDGVPSPDTTYYIGRFCMQNARTAHSLAHWKFHLNEWVVDYLKSKGYCTPEKIVERDGWSISKRRKDAEKIADDMEAVGEVKALYRDFKEEINTAHHSNDPYGRGMSSP